MPVFRRRNAYTPGKVERAVMLPATRTALAAGLAALALAGCGVDYYLQSVAGQADMLARARPIDEVLATTTDARLAERLERTREIRAYASSALGLPDNSSYTRYADLGRPYVVWNVVATPALSLTPRQWCYPVAGCVSYRGFFSEDEAKAEAARLSAAGDDVHIGGVPAYSTLGWFSDPVLSSFIRYPDTALARLVFHELAHQVAYVKDDSEFNESFAVAVEEAGLSRWIAGQSASPRHATLVAEHLRGDRMRAEFARLVRDARPKLAHIYASNLSKRDKLAKKREVLAALKAGYEEAKAADPAMAGYDKWFAGYENKGPSNAALAAVALYDTKVPAFRAMLAESGGDFPTFYARVRELADKPRDERNAYLAALSAGQATAASAR
jgi:predicted aminopeptidase